jgi:dTDP-4-dehydrorhamnose reductase
MRILLLGAGGQLGTALTARLGREIVPLGRNDIDLGDADRVHGVLTEAAPELVINAAAYNFVDRAESEREQAFAVNSRGPWALAKACAALEVPLVHVSTDYVFGRDQHRTAPYAETDTSGPVNEYGRTKLAGEFFVQAVCPKHFILRTCGLYGRAVSAGKGNFVETMLRLGRERGTVSVVDDQWCTPTSAVDLAGWIAELIATKKYGLYHATNSGSTTWCRLAREIFRCARLAVEVQPITTAQFGAKARRPAYSVLDNSKLAAAIGHPLRPWEEALAEYLRSR